MTSNYIPSSLRDIKKTQRKSARQQVREERERVLNELRAIMIAKKRTIPKEWERGFMSAVSALEIYKMENK